MFDPHPVFAQHGSFAHMPMGRLPARHDPLTLRLSKYLDKTKLPPLPATIDLIHPVPQWPMYGNDRLGDCTIAAAGHMIESWSWAAGGDKMPLDSDIEEGYWLTGDPPAKHGTAGGPTDTGRVEIDVLNFWRKTGFGGDKIDSYAAVDPDDEETMKYSMYLFGGVYTGVALPITAQSQHIWDVVGDGKTGDSAPGSWGGHAVPGAAYNPKSLSIITWGAPLEVTWRFVGVYFEEAYAIISPDWRTKLGKTIHGFDIEQLDADLAAIERR